LVGDDHTPVGNDHTRWVTTVSRHASAPAASLAEHGSALPTHSQDKKNGPAKAGPPVGLE